MIPKLEVGTILVAIRDFYGHGWDFKIIKGEKYKVVAINTDSLFYDILFVIINKFGEDLELPCDYIDTESNKHTFITLKQERKAKLENILV